MRVDETDPSGLLLIEPRCFQDERGFFLETFHLERYGAGGIVHGFVQDNHSRSRQGVLRGLHFQIKRPHAQIVTVTRGRIFDVAVDLRPDVGDVWALAGCRIKRRHGTRIRARILCAQRLRRCALQSESAVDGANEGGLVWNDADVGICWPIADPIVSQRDSAYPALRQLDRARPSVPAPIFSSVRLTNPYPKI